MSRTLKVLLYVWAVAAVAYGTVLAIWQPSGAVKWALWAVAAVPFGIVVNAVVEGTAHLFMSLPGMKQGTRYFESRAEGKQFSLARATWYGFAAVLGFTAVVSIVGLTWSLYLSAYEFIAVDNCLDSGGRWVQASKECER